MKAELLYFSPRWYRKTLVRTRFRRKLITSNGLIEAPVTLRYSEHLSQVLQRLRVNPTFAVSPLRKVFFL